MGSGPCGFGNRGRGLFCFGSSHRISDSNPCGYSVWIPGGGQFHLSDWPRGSFLVTRCGRQPCARLAPQAYLLLSSSSSRHRGPYLPVGRLALVCLFFSPIRIKRPSFGSLRIRDIRKACFGFMAIEAATTIYYRCDIILLERLGGDPASVGYYAAAYRFLDGITLLAAPLGIIWFRKLSC